MRKSSPYYLRVYKTFKAMSSKVPKKVSKNFRIRIFRTWKKLEQVNESTEAIDYKCNFQNGICKRYTGLRLEGLPLSKACCCKRCRFSWGYLGNIPDYAVREIVSLWSTRTGFWRQGRGCCLPRKWRSSVCLLYHCFLPREEDKTLRSLYYR